MDTVKTRIIGGICWVGVWLVLGVGTTEASQPSAGKLAQMGLSGVEIVTDSDALQVRGMGFSIAKVWGKAVVTGASPKVYHETGKHFAVGGKVVTSGGAFAGGFSFAFAK